MQTRLTTLETKWETVIPTLATREDLLALEGRLRDDMRHGFVDLQRWIVSAMQRWLLITVCVVAALAGGGASLVFKQRSFPALFASSAAAGEQGAPDAAFHSPDAADAESSHAGPADDAQEHRS